MSMADDHARYYADKRRIDALRAQIDAFLADRPRSLSLVAQRSLESARYDLQRDSDHLVAVFD